MSIDLAYFEEKLLDLQDQLLGISEMVGMASQTVELDQNRVGRLTRMDAIQGQAMALANIDRQKHQLQLISRALAKLDDGEFGLCESCDEPIAVARLEIEPTAQFCINCAAKIEQA